MSLINQMLADLEARKGGTLSHVDDSLDGLHPAASLRAALAERPRLMLGSLCLVAAIAALWTTREPLLDYLQAAPPAPLARTARPAPRAMPPASVPAIAPTPAPEAAAPSASTIVVLEPPPAEVLAPEAFDVRLPTSDTTIAVPPAPQALPLEPKVPAAPRVREVPPDLAPVYLEPEPDEATVVTPRAVREAPAAMPSIDAHSIEPGVEYPGSFHRSQTDAPAVSPHARRIAEIDALFANGNRDAALQALRAFVLANPAEDTARERLALELVADSRVTEAEALLRAGLRLTPGSTLLAQPLAHLLLAQNQADAALAVMRAATPPLAGHTEFHALLAAAEQRTGAHGLAITRYRGLLKEQPLNGSWLVALAISLLAVDEKADATSTFARALDDRALPEPLRVYASREMVRLKDSAP